jgi:hypothetical protein
MPSRSEQKPGRNDPCWCGSGKKYENCHPRHDAAARTRLAELIERLRRDAPESYRDSTVYLEDLIMFAVADHGVDMFHPTKRN